MQIELSKAESFTLIALIDQELIEYEMAGDTVTPVVVYTKILEDIKNKIDLVDKNETT